jgi:hypothetical protein
VTSVARQLLPSEVFKPLIDMAASSVYKEVQGQAPPAISALAGISSNRAVLEAYGAVECMLCLLRSGKKSDTKLDALDTLHQLLLNSEACIKFLEHGGISETSLMSEHKDFRIKRMAAMALERLLSKSTLPMKQRVECANIHALCKFVSCGDVQASESAGGALWCIAKQSVKEEHRWPEQSIMELAKAVAPDVEVFDEPEPMGEMRAAKLMKGRTLTVKALSLLLAKDKTNRINLSSENNDLLTLLHKGFVQTGALIGRTPSEADLYFVRSIAELAASSHTCKMADDSQLIAWASASIPRLLFTLKDAMPSHWSQWRKQVSRLSHQPDADMLPEDIEKHNCVVQIASRECFCLPVLRPLFVTEGFIPILLEVCSHREAKIRQNAACSVFYLVQDDVVDSILFAKSGDCDDGKLGNDCAKQALRLLESSEDCVVRMILLRICKIFGKHTKTLQELYAAGVVSVLCSIIADVLTCGGHDAQEWWLKKVFPLLKNAFSSIDLLLEFMEQADEIMEDMKSKDIVVWIWKCCDNIVLRYGALAWNAMDRCGRTKAYLHEYCMQPSPLSITVHKIDEFCDTIHRLGQSDPSNASSIHPTLDLTDPYVVLQIGKEKQKTSCKNNVRLCEKSRRCLLSCHSRDVARI